MMITADDVLKMIEITQKLEARGIKITDWDNNDIEIQYPNGHKERMTLSYGAGQLAKELNIN